jgi:WXG100 family type VII secretion target
MPRISADVRKLYRAADKCRDASRDLRDIKRDIRNTLSRTQWEGVARTLFDDQHRDWERDLERRIDGLKDLAHDLKRAAQKLERADRNSRDR